MENGGLIVYNNKIGILGNTETFRSCRLCQQISIHKHQEYIKNSNKEKLILLVQTIVNDTSSTILPDALL